MGDFIAPVAMPCESCFRYFFLLQTLNLHTETNTRSLSTYKPNFLSASCESTIGYDCTNTFLFHNAYLLTRFNLER